MNLKDSATSYYLESIALQTQLDSGFAKVPIKHWLRLELMYLLKVRGEKMPPGIQDFTFPELFAFCVKNYPKPIFFICRLQRRYVIKILTFRARFTGFCHVFAD